MIINPLQLAALNEISTTKAMPAHTEYVSPLEDMNNLSDGDLLRWQSGGIVGSSASPTNTDYNPAVVQYASIQCQGTTTLSIDGVGSINTAGVVANNSTDHPGLNIADASSFTCRFYTGTNFTYTAWNPSETMLFKTLSDVSTTNNVFFYGLMSNTSVVSGATFASGQSCAGLRFIVGTDTKLMLAVGTYLTVDTVDTGVTFDASTWYAVRMVYSGTDLNVYIGKSAVSISAAWAAASTASPITYNGANMPSSGQGMLLSASYYRGAGSVNRGFTFISGYHLARFMSVT